MLAGSAMSVERPANWRLSGQHRSAQASPATSRRSSISSVASAQSEPSLVSDNSRNPSTASAASGTTSSSTSGFKSLFGKKSKKTPKEKKDVGKIIITSKHAAAVKTKMMMDPRYKDRALSQAKTAGIVQSVHTGHLSAADQEARHPHSGPPALHAPAANGSLTMMPLLTRIVSGDERDEEDELTRLDRARSEWDMAKVPVFSQIQEHHESTDNNNNISPSLSSSSTTEEQSLVEEDSSPARRHTLSPNIEKALAGDERRASVTSRNSYGGRFRLDERGHWTR